MKITEELGPFEKSWLQTANARMSLRVPQKEALETLAYAVMKTDSEKSVSENLETIKEHAEGFTDFHFDFPSYCFALATGVGKTRLMGAMIYYLYKVKKYRNFFVVAPNLTIYEKLTQDFTYGSDKYVFKGIADFDASNPRIIDGNNYAQISSDGSQQAAFGFTEFESEVTINIFNISKFSRSEGVKIRKLSEYLGTSYFDYLKSLPDLVVLMDESHRYRADTSSAAINELNPILGLEFTATPNFQKGSKTTRFENIAYEYNLASAIRDWYVKIPWVATRMNFDNSLPDNEKDFIKLCDAISIHENAILDLKLYARNHELPQVKPFVMVSAANQAHADEIELLIKSDQFFHGEYKDKVVKIVSGSKAEERDEAIRKLLEVEKIDNPVEIVIQVMMLKEGWDVNNLYTIVPLRASASETLTEQTLGRGLRLPYGERTGDPSIDRLTIVAHDSYQKIVDIANDPNSLIKNVLKIDDRWSFGRPRQLVINSNTYDEFSSSIEGSEFATAISSGSINKEEAKKISEDIRTIIEEVIKPFELETASSSDLIKPEFLDRFMEKVREQAGKKSSFALLWSAEADISSEVFIRTTEQVALRFVEGLISSGIDLPEIRYDYGDVTVSFDPDFRVETDFVERLRIQESTIINRNLSTNELETFERPQFANYEWSIEDYIADIIMEVPELDYDTWSDFIYSNATVVSWAIRAKFPNENDDILLATISWLRKHLSDNLTQQFRSERVMKIVRSEAKLELSRSFRTVRATDFDAFVDGWILSFRETWFEKSTIKNIVFKGFKKCVSRYAKFDSDTERRFSAIVEDDKTILKWMKPPITSFRIPYNIGNDLSDYTPDFVIETADIKWIVEIKAVDEIDNQTVLAKAEAARKWCRDVNSVVTGKQWKYLLIEHDKVTEGRTLNYLASISQ